MMLRTLTTTRVRSCEASGMFSRQYDRRCYFDCFECFCGVVRLIVVVILIVVIFVELLLK